MQLRQAFRLPRIPHKILIEQVSRQNSLLMECREIRTFMRDCP
jgi:hypothetical protein